MAASQDADALLDAVESAVDEAIQYFQGPGATSRAIIDQWGPREVLCHFLFWHEATARGMESVAGGGESYRADAGVDEMNARAIARRTGQDIPTLIAEARELQARLAEAARSLGDPGATVMLRSDGTRLSVRQRLELFPRHWREHVAELQAASGTQAETG